MKCHYSENILYAPLEETVCWCSGVSKKQILQSIEQGAKTVDDIRHLTKACTVGRCKELSPRRRCCSKEIKMLLDAAIL